jgi:hypothetical protein
MGFRLTDFIVHSRTLERGIPSHLGGWMTVGHCRTMFFLIGDAQSDPRTANLLFYRE